MLIHSFIWNKTHTHTRAYSFIHLVIHMLENAVKKKICAQKSEEQTKKEGKK